MTANFSSPCSLGAVLRTPESLAAVRGAGGLRPTSTLTHTLAGSRVNEDRTALAATFDLRIETDVEMHYVDNSKVEHLRLVSYNSPQMWETGEELVTPLQMGEL